MYRITSIIIPFLQKRELKHREVKQLLQDHTAYKRQILDSNTQPVSKVGTPNKCVSTFRYAYALIFVFKYHSTAAVSSSSLCVTQKLCYYQKSYPRYMEN